MRDQIISTIYHLMQQDENIYFLTGDLGFNALEKLKDFGPRFINCGIAEANMIGVASGLALSGKKVYIYSIIPFVTLRCLEQIRNDICFHNLDVTILGMGAGLSYGVLGKTHYATEDLGLMRLLPNMKVFIPCDGIEGFKIIEKLHSLHGPAYLSLGKIKNNISDEKLNYKIGEPIQLEKGSMITIFSCGQLLHELKKACQILKENYNLSPNLINISCLNPVDQSALINYCQDKKMIFIFDEHTINGGIASLLYENLINAFNLPPVKTICLPGEVIKKIGSYEFLLHKYNLSSPQIVSQILKSLCI